MIDVTFIVLVPDAPDALMTRSVPELLIATLAPAVIETVLKSFIPDVVETKVVPLPAFEKV